MKSNIVDSVLDLKTQLQQSDKKHCIGRSTIDLLKEKLKKEEATSQKILESTNELEELLLESKDQLQIKDATIANLQRHIEVKNCHHQDVIKNITNKAMTLKTSAVTTLQQLHSEKMKEHSKMLTEAVSMAKRQDEKIRKMKQQNNELQGKLNALSRKYQPVTRDQNVQVELHVKLPTSPEQVFMTSDSTKRAVGSPREHHHQHCGYNEDTTTINLKDIIYTVQCQLEEIKATVSSVKQSRFNSYLQLHCQKNWTLKISYFFRKQQITVTREPFAKVSA